VKENAVHYLDTVELDKSFVGSQRLNPQQQGQLPSFLRLPQQTHAGSIRIVHLTPHVAHLSDIVVRGQSFVITQQLKIQQQEKRQLPTQQPKNQLRSQFFQQRPLRIFIAIVQMIVPERSAARNMDIVVRDQNFAAVSPVASIAVLQMIRVV
jgi:hypothetical protein